MLPRTIVPGATYMVTRRCTQRQYLLAPSKHSEEVFLYCLAYAARKTRVRVHAVIVMSNHYHLIVTDELGVLPVFVETLNKLVAKCMNAILGRWENFWATAQASYVRLLDADAVFDKIAYAMCNPVAAGACDRSDRWQGPRMWRAGKRRTSRPARFFRAVGCMPETLDLSIELPVIDGMTPDETRERIESAVAERESTLQERARIQGQPEAPAQVQEVAPTDSPRTREPRRRLSPTIATRDVATRRAAAAARAEFLEKYRAAFASWVQGIRTVCFPFGTYLMRVRHAAICAEA